MTSELLAVVLPKLATSAIRAEAVLRRGTYTISGHIESVGRSGGVSETKDGVFRVVSDALGPKVEVVSYLEDGADKTDEARKKAEDKAKERATKRREPDEEWHVPFLASQQPKYDFRIEEQDARDPARVKIGFSPKQPGQSLFSGSAWVDTRTGAFLSADFEPSKNPAFVDYVRVHVELGESTPIGPAVSKLSFEAGGGVLFLRKRVRGTAVVSGYQLPGGVAASAI
jgi:hypothetical protein